MWALFSFFFPETSASSPPCLMMLWIACGNYGLKAFLVCPWEKKIYNYFDFKVGEKRKQSFVVKHFQVEWLTVRLEAKCCVVALSTLPSHQFLWRLNKTNKSLQRELILAALSFNGLYCYTPKPLSPDLRLLFLYYITFKVLYWSLPPEI